MSCDDSRSDDKCDEQLLIVSADLGRGAFLAVLCRTHWHRRLYRAHLDQLAAEARVLSTSERSSVSAAGAARLSRTMASSSQLTVLSLDRRR